ncbi:hypothetical protein [Streptomyces sp. H27-C3]|uniref:hypothetical protein n=1 Tax=Streptomyces sp. H27-C3 TaxID=3046305 RepID=UPI0024B913A2|nr:hypothetical protein [Streptomyces sp. H27-C3]MDJ0460860.1 hypothetical protein [Streptomyces sp. H27-C3]
MPYRSPSRRQDNPRTALLEGGYLTVAAADLRTGDHACLFYGSEAEQLAELGSLVVAGNRARSAGLTGARLTMAQIVANEALMHLLRWGQRGGRPSEAADARVCTWEEPGILTWDLFATERSAAPAAWAGFAPPDADAGPDDGLWPIRNLRESVEFRTVEGRPRLRLRYAGAGNAERL